MASKLQIDGKQTEKVAECVLTVLRNSVRKPEIQEKVLY
jgi:hypothetical protein